MSVEVHLDWEGMTHQVGVLHSAGRGPTVTFEYAAGWLARPKAFAIDPTGLPLRPGPHHGSNLFGAIQDCGPDRWGRLLIERAVRHHILESKPYRDLDYVLALDDSSRIGALRFRADASGPFLAACAGRIPPVVQLAALLNAADAVHGETETAQDLSPTASASLATTCGETCASSGDDSSFHSWRATTTTISATTDS